MAASEHMPVHRNSRISFILRVYVYQFFSLIIDIIVADICDVHESDTFVSFPQILIMLRFYFSFTSICGRFKPEMEIILPRDAILVAPPDRCVFDPILM